MLPLDVATPQYAQVPEHEVLPAELSEAMEGSWAPMVKKIKKTTSEDVTIEGDEATPQGEAEA